MNTLELLKRASDMEKKAYADYVTNFTQAGIVSLVKGGVQFEKAAEMMRQACEGDATASRLQAGAVAFEKVAEYVAELEGKVSELEKIAGEAVLEAKTLDENDPLHKLASAGFTQEEIAMMAQMPNDLIEKVASVNSRPEGMGSAVGFAREKTDPLLEFILG